MPYKKREEKKNMQIKCLKKQYQFRKNLISNLNLKNKKMNELSNNFPYSV